MTRELQRLQPDTPFSATVRNVSHTRCTGFNYFRGSVLLPPEQECAFLGQEGCADWQRVPLVLRTLQGHTVVQKTFGSCFWRHLQVSRYLNVIYRPTWRWRCWMLTHLNRLFFFFDDFALNINVVLNLHWCSWFYVTYLNILLANFQRLRSSDSWRWAPRALWLKTPSW